MNALVFSRGKRHEQAVHLPRARRLLDGDGGLRRQPLRRQLSMRVRATGANAATHLVYFWNSSRSDKIKLSFDLI